MASKTRFVTTWRNKFLTTEAKTIDDMIDRLQGAADTLREMKEAGIKLAAGEGTEDDYATLYTTKSDVARRFDMQDERELYGLDKDGQ